MRPLRPSDRLGLEKLCRSIREHLHLEHKEHFVEYSKERTKSDAALVTTNRGWFIRLRIFREFWNNGYEGQVRVLVHEHVHACMIPYDQQADAALEDVPEAIRGRVSDAVDRGRELAVCHLESVLYDLLKAKL